MEEPSSSSSQTRSTTGPNSSTVPNDEPTSSSEPAYDRHSGANPVEEPNEPTCEPMDQQLVVQPKQIVIKKRMIRRGRRRSDKNKDNNSNNKFNLYISNIRSAKAKMVLLQNIIYRPSVNSNVILLIETKKIK